tara:strand:- start:950 stop:1372 length:423 start_codon:yes stop_codon:yes gene_type:complete
VKSFVPLFASTVLAVATAACEPADTQGLQPETQTMSINMEDAARMPTLSPNERNQDTGRAMGNIVSIGSDGGSVTIDHGPFEGIGMGAMTMNFALMGEADLVGFSEGDRVSFEVKRGRDGSFRIINICNADESDTDCFAD